MGREEFVAWIRGSTVITGQWQSASRLTYWTRRGWELRLQQKLLGRCVRVCFCFFFFLLWFADTSPGNEISTGIWSRNNGRNRLHEKVENLVGLAKSLAYDVFNCVIKFTCRVIIYWIIAEKTEGSYHVLRDGAGHPPVLGLALSSFQISTNCTSNVGRKKAPPHARKTTVT